MDAAYPSGTAAAVTLRSLHEHGDKSARQAKALGIGGLAGAGLTWFRDAAAPWIKYPNLPATWVPTGSGGAATISTRSRCR